MKVQFFAYLRDKDFAGCKETAWSAVPTLRDLGESLCAAYGSKFRNEFFSPSGEALGDRVIVMINGRRAEFLDGLDTALKETDTVLIFPVVAGG